MWTVEEKKAESRILGFIQLGAQNKIKEEREGAKERKWRGGMT